jgi:hypothetical protein
MTKFNLSALTIACCLAIGTGTVAAATSKAEYKTAKDEIAAKYKSDKATCAPMTGNAKDICMAQAKGDQTVERAKLEESHHPSYKHRYAVRVAQADATYAVAKEKCDDLAGNAKDVCVKEAKAAHVSAKADAKLSEKTSDANVTAGEQKAGARKDASADKRAADYAVAKEKCEPMAGDVKANCIKDAKARYGQT